MFPPPRMKYASVDASRNMPQLKTKWLIPDRTVTKFGARSKPPAPNIPARFDIANPAAKVTNVMTETRDVGLRTVEITKSVNEIDAVEQ